MSVSLFVWMCVECHTDVEETPFELRSVTIRRDKRFADEFEIIDFLGRYKCSLQMQKFSFDTLIFMLAFIICSSNSIECRGSLLSVHWFTF